MKLKNELISGFSGVVVSSIFALSIGGLENILEFLFAIVIVSLVSLLSSFFIKTEKIQWSILLGGSTAFIVCICFLALAVSNI